MAIALAASPWGAASAAEATTRDRLLIALDILAHVPAGRELLGRAQRYWDIPRPEGLRKVLRWGKASKTDAMLTRHFNPVTGAETRERQVTVYLREDQRLEDIVLDLAHELVHATSRPSWDPYDPQLTAGKYIWAAIEGEGGEVDAVESECRVGFEILERYGAASPSSRRCRGYVGGGERLSRDLIRRDFYRVGKWSAEIQARLGGERDLFPLLNPDSPRLYSSTGNAPYPVALYREYEEITQIACENTRKRVQASRSPASGAPPDAAAPAFIARRCSVD